MQTKPVKNMIQQRLRAKANKTKDGFSLIEAVVTTSIIGIISSIAIPNYISSNNNSKASAAKATIQSIPPIIGAFIDATGEAPTTWDDLSSIAAVMTNDGPATGVLGTPITLPSAIYDLSIEGPAESVYTMTATRVSDREKEEENIDQVNYQYAVKSCFNISNGASDIKSGVLSDIENTLNCG